MQASVWPVVQALVHDLGGVASARELGAGGISAAAIAWSVRTGRLRRLRHGAYTTEAAWLAADVVERHLLLLRARQRLDPERVATGLTAAVVHGLPIPSRPPAEPIVTVARGKEHRGAVGHRGASLDRRAWLDPTVVTVRDGYLVTDPVRTVIDCARACSAPWGLAIADAAAARGLLTQEEVVVRLRETPPMPGRRRASWAAARLDARAESPLESLARALVLLAGLPPPEPQVWVRGADGRDYRVDLMDVEHRTAIEADGRLKYGSPEDLWNEKLREDAIRAVGIDVVRFTMLDRARPDPWLNRYRRALRRHGWAPR